MAQTVAVIGEKSRNWCMEATLGHPELRGFGAQIG
jgi:hypothetical protein